MATKIICRAIDCIFNEAKRCTSAEIIYDPAEGCLTYEAAEEDVLDLDQAEEEWEEDELLLEDENEGLGWDDDDLGLEDDEELDEDTMNDDW
jgi:hypothetical protein